MTLKVIEEIRSYGKDRKVFAKAGDTVKVICQMNDMWILENSKGEKFSTKNTKVKCEKQSQN